MGMPTESATNIQKISSHGIFKVRSLLPSELLFEVADRSRWKVVSKLIGNQYILWVLMGPSYFLANIGATGDGVYGLKDFVGPSETRGINGSKGDIIGGYTGVIIAGPFSSNKSVQAKKAGHDAACSGCEHLLWINQGRQKPGWILVNGVDSGPPFMHKINDGRSIKTNNVEFQKSGIVRATKGIYAADLNACNLENLRHSEFLVSYGATFWSFWSSKFPLHATVPSMDETSLDSEDVPYDTTCSQNTDVDCSHSLDTDVRQVHGHVLATRPRRIAADRACAAILQATDLTCGPSPRGISISTKNC